MTPGLPSTPLVDGAAAGSEGCLTGLNAALVTGKIVLCEGSFQRAARSLAVKQAGGVGMVLYTATETDALMSDTHHVPAVHVTHSSGLAIKAYIAGAGAAATASLSGGSKEFGGGNTMAAFSSRGPLLPSDRSTGDLLKPDVTAPGRADPRRQQPGRRSSARPASSSRRSAARRCRARTSPASARSSRTSTPTWTPAEMQSAIMTSARQDVLKEDGVTPADPFDFGGGHVVPNGAADPGLVYPVDVRRLPGLPPQPGPLHRSASAPARPRSSPPTDLNVPSVTIRALAGTLTVTRKVKNVGAAGTYKVSVDGAERASTSPSPRTS